MTWPTIRGRKLGAREAFLALLALDVVLFATKSGGPGLATLLVFWAAGFAFLKLTSLLMGSRLIWKLRNRLIVTYVFIAVVPIFLFSALVFTAGYFLIGQTSTYLVGSALYLRDLEIEKTAGILASEAPESRLATAQHLTAVGIPDFEVLVTGDAEFRYPAVSTLDMPPAGWRDYTGVVYRNGGHYLMSLVTRGRNRALILRSLSPQDLTDLVRGLGIIDIPIPGGDDPDYNQNPARVAGQKIVLGTIAGVLPPAFNFFDREVTWPLSLHIATWGRPNSGMESGASLTTRPSAVFSTVFQSAIVGPENFLYGFYGLAALLGLAWLASLYVGISMTRTITEAVHNLHQGTNTIGAGDFVHRIPVKGRDQLADLGRSFNHMSGQLGQFVVVTKEKERLQSEIAIASEVQTRLFPNKPPSANTIEMLGVCHAARSVSGDYYDYFIAASGELALALGDVAGKGISAALLMASIQSIMRTQLFDGGAILTPSATVARLNRLLYAHTSPEKYATFFFGLYNENTRQFTYTNAGHLPPLLIHRDGYRLLEVTGSVVGAFPSLRYEEQTVAMEPGDLLVAYTDGITEPENEYGEEFGAERLAAVIMLHRDAPPEKIVEKVLEAVRHWDVAAEQADDMTLMIVRSLA